MDNKFLGALNGVQQIYNELGVLVPVGDLSTGKAPAIQPLPSTSTQTTVTAQFNVMSGADITSLSYKVNDGEATSITPAKGVVTITLSDLEYNSGPYEIELTATNETGSTVTSSTVALQHYTNWATPDEVLLGNKYIGEDGQEHTGEYECPTCPEPVLETVPVTPTTSAQTITPSTGYDGIGQVNVSAVTSAIDANITAGNIKNGVTILGVTGDYQGSASNPTLDNIIENPSQGYQLGVHDLDNVTSIGDYAFFGNHLTGAVTIPSNITSIGVNAFANTDITSLTIPNTVLTYGGFTDGYASYNYAQPNFIEEAPAITTFVLNAPITTYTWSLMPSLVLASVTLPNTVTTIANGAFEGTQLTQITIPSSVTTIGEHAFGGCKLTSVTIPVAVQTIGNDAFYDMRTLTSVTFEGQLSTLGSYVFEMDSNLNTIRFLGSKPLSMNSSFSYTDSTSGTIYIPSNDSSWDNVESDPEFTVLLNAGWTLVRE